MARKRVVTRTITGTVVTVKCADIENNTIYDSTITLSGKFKNAESALKAAKKRMDSDCQNVLQVIDTNVTTNKYEMDEDEYIANARIVNN